jgi:hypothetical protein
MAKPKSRDLAALAALGAIGYKLSQNKSAQTSAPVEGTREARPESTETRLKTPAQSIAEAQKKAPVDAESSMQSNILNAITKPKEAPSNNEAAPVAVKNPVAKKKPVASSNTSQTSTDRSMSQTTTQKPVSGNSTKTQEELMAAYKPRYTPPVTAPKTTQGKTYEKKPYMPDAPDMSIGRKKGGAIKKMASGGMTSGASRRGDGIASRGKTRGKIC